MERRERLPPGHFPGFRREVYAALIKEVASVLAADGDVPCLRPGADPEWWCSEDRDGEARAKALCRACPSVAMCAIAGAINDEGGVWGGLSKTERRALMAKSPKIAQYFTHDRHSADR